MGSEKNCVVSVILGSFFFSVKVDNFRESPKGKGTHSWFPTYNRMFRTYYAEGKGGVATRRTIIRKINGRHD